MILVIEAGIEPATPLFHKRALPKYLFSTTHKVTGKKSKILSYSITKRGYGQDSNLHPVVISEVTLLYGIKSD